MRSCAKYKKDLLNVFYKIILPANLSILKDVYLPQSYIWPTILLFDWSSVIISDGNYDFLAIVCKL